MEQVTTIAGVEQRVSVVQSGPPVALAQSRIGRRDPFVNSGVAARQEPSSFDDEFIAPAPCMVFATEEVDNESTLP